MEEKNDHKKIIWIILFALLSVVLCYMFVVIYFFYIDSYNISAKLAVWPFFSESSKVEQYSNAVVDVSFEFEDDNLDTQKYSTVGVNIHKDGYVVVMYDYFRNCSQDTQINVKTNAGESLVGKIVFCDIRFNLAILKCQTGDGRDVKLPYLRIGNFDELGLKDKVYAISSPLNDKNKFTMAVGESQQIISEITESNYIVVDYFMKDCKTLTTQDEPNFKTGAIVDSSGKFEGLAFQVSSSSEGGPHYCMMNGSYIKSVLNSVVDCVKKNKPFECKLAESFHGFDKNDYKLFNVYSSDQDGNGYLNGFYFEGKIEDYTEESEEFGYSNIDGFFLFKDLKYNDQEILTAGNVITSFRIDNKNAVQINTSENFIYEIYKLKSGQKLTLNYITMGQDSDGEESSVSLTV